VSGLSCCGSVTSDVVGSGWTRVTLLRTVRVGSLGFASLVPWSARGSGASRIFSFVILSPRSYFFGRQPSGSGALLWAWCLLAIVGASGELDVAETLKRPTLGPGKFGIIAESVTTLLRMEVSGRVARV
jgi:hypothetical protein